MEHISKISEWYRLQIRPHLQHLRGTTRTVHVLEWLALQPLTSKKGSSTYTSDRFGFAMRNRNEFRYLIRESQYVEKFSEIVGNDDVVADIGSFHGFYGCLASNLTNGTIHCFEPSEQNRRVLEENVNMNDGKSFDIVGKAVWDDKGTETFLSAANASRVGKGEETVRTVSLDNYFKDREGPDIVKIDAEGGEMKVLEGAERVLDEEEPHLFIEVHVGERFAEFSHTPQDVKRWLGRRGYRTEKIMERPEETLLYASPVNDKD